MNERVFIRACAAALALGAAAALSGCSSSTTSTASSSGATVSTSTSAAATAAATATTGDVVSVSASTGASATTTTGNGGSAQNAGGSACANGKVSVKLGSEDASTSHRGLVLLFTNTGSSTCTLIGYPGATVTDSGMSNFAPLVNATRTLTGFEGGASAISMVSLAPGGSASALLEWEGFPANGEPASAANCYGMAGGYLEITPPNTTASTRFDPPDDMCQAVQIHPVVPGSSGRTAG
jgi:Protein of unknown function (DUF4232)